jgi:hypothetical protein
MPNFNDGLFWAARLVNNNIEFYRSSMYTKNAEIYQDGHIPYKFLKLENNEVSVISQAEQDQITQYESYVAEQEQLRIQQEQLDEQERINNLPFDISKLQLCLKLKELNKLEDFMVFINTDEETKFLWNAASVLTSDNQLLQTYLQKPEVIAILPENQLEFLKLCKI